MANKEKQLSRTGDATRQTTFDVKRIERIARDVSEMTAWSPVPSGSVLRVPSYAYKNWGIRITPYNELYLYVKAGDAYKVEWADTDKKLNDLVGEASRKAGLGDVNALMNARVGQLVAHEASFRKGRPFFAVDIGAGAGATSLEVVKEMERAGIRTRNSSIMLIEPSARRGAAAKTAIEETAFCKENRIEVILSVGTDTSVLNRLERGSVDFIYQNAAIHHNAFREHLQGISNALSPEGVFVSGDWHESMWYNPARAYWQLAILRDLDNKKLVAQILNLIETGKAPADMHYQERKELTEFRRYFSINGMEPLMNAYHGLRIDEKKANKGIAMFWGSVGEIFSEAGMKAPIYFLEAHEAMQERLKGLKDADLLLRDTPEKMLKERRLGELAVVMSLEKRA